MCSAAAELCAERWTEPSQLSPAPPLSFLADSDQMGPIQWTGTSEPRSLETSQPRNLAASQPRSLAASQSRDLGAEPLGSDSVIRSH